MTEFKRKACALVAITILMPSLVASAYDFMIDDVAYNILPDGETVEVTYSDRTGYNYIDNSSYEDLSHIEYTIGKVNYAGVTSLTIPDQVTIQGKTYRVTAIGKCAFEGTEALQSISLPATVKKIGFSFFESSITTIDVANLSAWCAVEYSGNVLISDNLPSARTPEGIYIKQYFYPLVLRRYDKTYDEDFETIDESEWFAPTGVALTVAGSPLTKVELPSDVTTVRWHDLCGQTSIQQLVLHSGVMKIETHAFDGCTGLREVVCRVADPSNITMGSDVFNHVAVEGCTLYVPQGSKNLYDQAAQWQAFGTIVEGEPDSEASSPRGDLDGNGMVDIDDLNELINIILGKS